MEYNIKPTKPPRQEGGFPQTIPQLIQKYKLDSMWEEITKTVKDIIQQELGQKALKGTSLTVKGIDGEEGFIQVLDKEDKPIVEINNNGVEVGEGKTITEGGNEVNKSVEWEDVQNKPKTFPPSEHNHDDKYYTKNQIESTLKTINDNIGYSKETVTLNGIRFLCKKFGKIVTIQNLDQISFSGDAQNRYYDTIPETYRPTTRVYKPDYCNDGYAISVNVLTNGRIEISPSVYTKDYFLYPGYTIMFIQ